MSEQKSAEYGPVLTSLVACKNLPPLDPGELDSSVDNLINGLTDTLAFEAFEIEDRAMAKCCIAGILLLHNRLEMSHKISQEIESPTGSYWHGLMHRREPDFSNSKYWFRRFKKHPVWIELCPTARELSKKIRADAHTDFLQIQKEWDPFKFVDLCESALGSGSERERLCREIQMQEWKFLFDYSFNHAIGKS
jgi:hypothetical protein